MNAYATNHAHEPVCSTKAGVLRHPVFAIALIAGGLNISAARADNTVAKASLGVWGEAACTTPTCSEAQITVTLKAFCSPGPSCTVIVKVEKEEDCGLFAAGFDSLDLYDNPTGTCAGTGTGAPYPVDLLAGTFVLSPTQWDDLLAGNQLIVARAGGGGEATGSANPQKAIGDEIPTLSEWGVVLMTLVLIVAGTILFGQFRTRASAT